MLVEHVGLPVDRVVLNHVIRLFEGDHRGDRVAVGEVLVIVLSAGALDKGNPCGHLTALGQFLKFSVGDHVGQFAVAKVFVFRDIGRLPAGGKHDCAEDFTFRVEHGVLLHALVRVFQLTLVDQILLVSGDLGRSVPFRAGSSRFEGHVELAGAPADTGHFTAGFDGDFAVRLHLGNHLLDVGSLQLGVRVGRGEHFPPPQRLAAQLGVFLDDGHLVAGCGRFLGRGESGDTAAHDQDLLADGFQLVRYRQFRLLSPGDGHAHIVSAHLLEKIVDTAIFLQAAGPGDMLAQVAAHGDGLLAKIEFLLHDPGRTGADNDSVDAIVGNVLLDEGPSVGTAETGVLLHVDARISSRILQAIHIEDVANATTSTEICTIYFLH